MIHVYLTRFHFLSFLLSFALYAPVLHLVSNYVCTLVCYHLMNTSDFSHCWRLNFLHVFPHLRFCRFQKGKKRNMCAALLASRVSDKLKVRRGTTISIHKTVHSFIFQFTCNYLCLHSMRMPFETFIDSVFVVMTAPKTDRMNGNTVLGEYAYVSFGSERCRALKAWGRLAGY